MLAFAELDVRQDGLRQRLAFARNAVSTKF